MNREIEQAILTEGYRFCRVQPENIGVFYKYYQQGFHVVMMISLEDTQALTVEQHQVIQERVMDLFYHPQGRLADFPEGYPVYHVELLTLLSGNNTDMMHQLCCMQKNVWGYDMKQGRLIIYENQPGDFWGLKNALENCRAESKSTGSTNPGFSLKGLSDSDCCHKCDRISDTGNSGRYAGSVLYCIPWRNVPGVHTDQSSVVEDIYSDVYSFWFTTPGKQYGNILLCWIETGAGSRSF